jgi:hypothetical protein
MLINEIVVHVVMVEAVAAEEGAESVDVGPIIELITITTIIKLDTTLMMMLIPRPVLRTTWHKNKAVAAVMKSLMTEISLIVRMLLTRIISPF